MSVLQHIVNLAFPSSEQDDFTNVGDISYNRSKYALDPNLHYMQGEGVFSEGSPPYINFSGLPNSTNKFGLVGFHDGESIGLVNDSNQVAVFGASGIYGIGAAYTGNKIYNSSLISASLHLDVHNVRNHPSEVQGQIGVELSNFVPQSNQAIFQVDSYSSGTAVSGSLTPGNNTFDITTQFSGLVYDTQWDRRTNFLLAIVPSYNNSGLVSINLEESYITLNYNAVVPFPPLSPVGDPLFSAIDVAWNVPEEDGGASITEYIVEYAVRTSLSDATLLSEWQVAGTTTDTSFRVENLNNDNLYIFRIAARNSVGLSPYSINSSPIQPDKSKAPTAANTFNDANYTRLRLRRDTAVNWSGTNPILGLGEPGFETDTNLLKIGNNTSGWNDLDYVKVDNDSIVFPTDRDVYLTVGDTKTNEDSAKLSMNLSQNEKINIVAEKGIDLQYNSNFNSLVFSLDQVFNPFNSGEIYSPYSRGLAGNVNFTDDKLYVCTDTNFWKRIDLNTTKWFDPESVALSLESGSYPSVTEIYFSGTNAIISTDGDPFPAKASTNLVNDGITSRSDFFNAYQIGDQNTTFTFRYRGGNNATNSESAISGYNGVFANGVKFSAPRAGSEAIGLYVPPEGLHYNRTHFSTYFKMDDCGGYVDFSRTYSYYHGAFLNRCWNNGLVYNNNSYYSGSNYNGDYFRHSNGHSKILGFCFDGYPVYGPFGYTDSDDPNSVCSLMTSSYIAKTGDDHRPTDWKYHNALTVNDINYNLDAGAFIEDFEYAEGSGILDQYNGRYSITPEYPQGTYAYHLTFTSDSLLIPKYPYIVGNFSKNKKLKQDLETALLPITVDGYFPLFISPLAANSYGLLNGADGSYETLVILANTYYRPLGVPNATDPAPPTDITLSDNRISEKATIGAIIGTFATTDLNADDNHTYSLVTGDGSDDNASFTIFNNELRVNSVLSYSIQNTYNIRVKTTDETNRSFEKAFTINVVAGTTFTSLNITSIISSLLAGDQHTFGLETEGTAQDITYSWSHIGSPYATAVGANTGTEYVIDTTNVQQRNDETVNVAVTATSVSAFNSLIASTSFLLDHSEDPVCIAGYYPLYSSEADAIRAPGGNGTAHQHTVQGVFYWMPNGLDAHYHGNFDCDSLTPSKTEICLDGSIDVTIANTGDGNRYVFDGNSSNTHKFKANTGTYVFNNVPSNHPIAFHNNGIPISYSGTTLQGNKTALDGNAYDYYYGTVTGVFGENFGTTSYECFYHGYMGGQNNLVFDSSCTSPSPPSSTPTLTSASITSASTVNGGSSISLTASSVGTATDVTYAWSISSATGATLSVTTGTSVNLNTTDLDTDTDQTVTVTLTATSVSAGNSVTDTKTITISQSADSSTPTLTSVSISGNSTVNGGTGVTLTATPVGTATDVTYSWTITSSATGASLSGTTGSSITVNTTDLNTNTDQSITIQVTASSTSASSSVTDTHTILIYQSSDGGGGGGGGGYGY